MGAVQNLDPASPLTLKRRADRCGVLFPRCTASAGRSGFALAPARTGAAASRRLWGAVRVETADRAV